MDARLKEMWLAFCRRNRIQAKRRYLHRMFVDFIKYERAPKFISMFQSTRQDAVLLIWADEIEEGGDLRAQYIRTNLSLFKEMILFKYVWGLEERLIYINDNGGFN